MNKQQLIDKAIDDLGGVWPKGQNNYGLIITTEKNTFWGAGKYDFYHLKEDVISGGGDIVWTYICTRQEFEARKAERDAMTNNIELINQARKELGLENTPIIEQRQLDAIEAKISEIKSREQDGHWYDYKTQKALRLPPVGEVVLLSEIEADEKATVIAHHNGSVICEVYGRYRGFSADSLRPIGWDKLIADDLHPLVDLLQQHEAFTFRGIALAILAAGYRKCDNKTSSDKE